MIALVDGVRIEDNGNEDQHWHFVCAACYTILFLFRNPGAPQYAGKRYCCRCGNQTAAALLYAADPNRFPCFGTHPYLPYWLWTREQRDEFQREYRGK